VRIIIVRIRIGLFSKARDSTSIKVVLLGHADRRKATEGYWISKVLVVL